MRNLKVNKEALLRKPMRSNMEDNMFHQDKLSVIGNPSDKRSYLNKHVRLITTIRIQTCKRMFKRLQTALFRALKFEPLTQPLHTLKFI